MIDLASCSAETNISENEYSYLQLTTAEDRILAFSAENFNRLESFLNVIIVKLFNTIAIFT